MTNILILAEHDGRELNPSTAKCVACALAVGGDIDLLVLGKDLAAVAEQAARLQGVRKVLVSEAEHLAHPLAPTWGAELVDAAGDYTHLLGPSTTLGRDLMPWVAARLGVNQVSDIMAVEGPRHFNRPIYAGNAIIDVHPPEDTLVVGTVRSASWTAVEEGGSGTVESRSAVSQAASHTRFVEVASGSSERPDLQTARIVVSGGRALGSAENFDLLYTLADRLGAGVGASRAAVDAGYVPNEMQVGQTGKIIAPELYMAFGISGAIQHLTGIKDAGTIVAVNKDADAPIFDVADIGLVGDLFTIVPELSGLLG